MMKRILLSHYVSNSKHFITFSYINKTYQDESHEGWYAQSTYFLSPHYHSIKVIVIYTDHANFLYIYCEVFGNFVSNCSSCKEREM